MPDKNRNKQFNDTNPFVGRLFTRYPGFPEYSETETFKSEMRDMYPDD